MFGNNSVFDTPTIRMPSVVNMPTMVTPNFSTFHAPLTSVNVNEPVGVDVGFQPIDPVKFIEETEGDWVFRLTLNKLTNEYQGCGPQKADGQMAEWGVCVSYSASKTEKAIRKELKKVLEKGREAVEEQQRYAQDLADWEAKKEECLGSYESGYYFDYYNKDGTKTGYPDFTEWECVRQASATPPGSEEEVVEEKEEEEEDEATTPSVNQMGGSVNIGFGEGFTKLLKTGLIVSVVGVIGYGAYNLEKKSNFFSNKFEKGRTKKASKKGTDKINKRIN